ncbi:hypothetical protein PTSG_11529 [Salpingoeca rosetta]|uniref:Uncharacterized protein n=1 Tax=Salpingoeca rosetta (strain ATCC 50818 / BSB-021) TaxID=946362 RepID=F2TVE4_SALR5|nr:uncharacterized protein PTSG_11529 [Salpingoeca rosetta]EGD72040.1 hypothetical protein PTSG_11529 [Salpingoeca rosetta]|eukprot:XP_004998612.1 hypothetical protein PTSG_11529 [Salpingoeca rosetta]
MNEGSAAEQVGAVASVVLVRESIRGVSTTLNRTNFHHSCMQYAGCNINNCLAGVLLNSELTHPTQQQTLQTLPDTVLSLQAALRVLDGVDAAAITSTRLGMYLTAYVYCRRREWNVFALGLASHRTTLGGGSSGGRSRAPHRLHVHVNMHAPVVVDHRAGAQVNRRLCSLQHRALVRFISDAIQRRAGAVPDRVGATVGVAAGGGGGTVGGAVGGGGNCGATTGGGDVYVEVSLSVSVADPEHATVSTVDCAAVSVHGDAGKEGSFGVAGGDVMSGKQSDEQGDARSGGSRSNNDNSSRNTTTTTNNNNTINNNNDDSGGSASASGLLPARFLVLLEDLLKCGLRRACRDVLVQHATSLVQHPALLAGAALLATFASLHPHVYAKRWRGLAGLVHTCASSEHTGVYGREMAQGRKLYHDRKPLDHTQLDSITNTSTNNNNNNNSNHDSSNRSSVHPGHDLDVVWVTHKVVDGYALRTLCHFPDAFPCHDEAWLHLCQELLQATDKRRKQQRQQEERQEEGRGLGDGAEAVAATATPTLQGGLQGGGGKHSPRAKNAASDAGHAKGNPFALLLLPDE